MNLFSDIRAVVISALDAMTAEGALPAGLDFGNVTVEPPRDAAHGDMATNAAMVLAKPAGAKPRDIAENLVGKLTEDARIASAEVAGPGFINLRLAEGVWQGLLPAILKAGEDFGHSKMGQGEKVNVEFVSANPTGPLHVGHLRGAVFGDALASLLGAAGYDVTREYYINDGGGQVDVLARSVYLRYLEAHGQEVAFPDGTYPGDYLIPVGRALKDKVGDAYVGKPEEDWLAEVRVFATDAMMDLIRSDLKGLGIEMDVFSSEKALYGTGKIEGALKKLDDAGLIYEGKLDPPKGKLPEDWEAREQTLFRSTEYGDDSDRPVKKSDGSWTYFAPDIAYHYDKIERGFGQLIDVLGADHGGYVKRMNAAVTALSDGKVPFDARLCQIVRLFKNGEEFKMSKRAGNFVLVSDVIDEVGRDIARFVMLTRKNDAPLDFDFDKVREQSKDNMVWYVQYTYARIMSVLTKGGQPSDAEMAAADLSSLNHPAQIALIRKLAEWPRLVEAAAQHHEPHRIAFYLNELAAEFHSFYNLGNSEPALRFVDEGDQKATLTKLALARAVSVVISAGLGILGIEPMDEMR
ncbi:arginine--tRNA ligase [Paracoccaceae bacterium GXU_MW_L88]